MKQTFEYRDRDIHPTSLFLKVECVFE